MQVVEEVEEIHLIHQKAELVVLVVEEMAGQVDVVLLEQLTLAVVVAVVEMVVEDIQAVQEL